MLESFQKNKVYIAVGIIWLFHISALIGTNFAGIDWFIEKTPLNLSLCLILFIMAYPIDRFVPILLFFILFLGGMFAEWLGVKYGILFGTYTYGNNFGFKIDGVPLLIGTYWAILTFATKSISEYVKISSRLKIILAAVLMVLLDYFMEQNAPRFDFWAFEGNSAPLKNYITWFFLAILFQILLRFYDVKGNRFFCLNLYMAQLAFFIYFTL
mgnify:CR=1 FL=1